MESIEELVKGGVVTGPEEYSFLVWNDDEYEKGEAIESMMDSSEFLRTISQFRVRFMLEMFLYPESKIEEFMDQYRTQREDLVEGVVCRVVIFEPTKERG